MRKNKNKKATPVKEDREMVLLTDFDSGPIPAELLEGAENPLRWDDLNRIQQIMVAGTSINSMEVAAAFMRGERPFPDWVEEMHQEKMAEEARKQAEEQRLAEIDAADPIPNGALRRYFRELQKRKSAVALREIDIDDVFGQRPLNEEDTKWLREEVLRTVTKMSNAHFPLRLLIAFARGDWKTYEAEVDKHNRAIELINMGDNKRKPSLTYGAYQRTFTQL